MKAIVACSLLYFHNSFFLLNNQIQVQYLSSVPLKKVVQMHLEHHLVPELALL